MSGKHSAEQGSIFTGMDDYHFAREERLNPRVGLAEQMGRIALQGIKNAAGWLGRKARSAVEAGRFSGDSYAGSLDEIGFNTMPPEPQLFNDAPHPHGAAEPMGDVMHIATEQARGHVEGIPAQRQPAEDYQPRHGSDLTAKPVPNHLPAHSSEDRQLIARLKAALNAPAVEPDRTNHTRGGGQEPANDREDELTSTRSS